jgi:phage tail protein X
MRKEAWHRATNLGKQILPRQDRSGISEKVRAPGFVHLCQIPSIIPPTEIIERVFSANIHLASIRIARRDIRVLMYERMITAVRARNETVIGVLTGRQYGRTALIDQILNL